MHYLHEPVQALFFVNPEGLGLKLAQKLLPYRSKLNLNTYLHLHLQSNFSAKTSGGNYRSRYNASKLTRLLKSLTETVTNCNFSETKTSWTNYYEEAAPRENYLNAKKEIIEAWLSEITAIKAIDLGANDGSFSEMLASKNIFTISADSDHSVINKLYTKIQKKGILNIHPLLINLANPTPSFGLNNLERDSFINRSNTDLVIALALIHHLAIAKNISFEEIANLFRKLGKKLIVEFIPKEDEKIKLLLAQRKDVFENYTEENFLKAFSVYYKIINSQEIGNSKRKLFLMDLL
jgi:2-polyprenyl-3-methyl-5-hydroxy-6-metoxy-1,4-benzoquinol methylase